MTNYKNSIVQIADQDEYRIRGNILWFVPFLLFSSVGIFCLGLGVYLNWLYLPVILLALYLNIKSKGHRVTVRPYILICLVYFMFCLFHGLINDVKPRQALQDIYGILYFLVSYGVVLSYKFNDGYMIKNISIIINLLIIVSCLNVFNTVFSIVQSQDQEGYRLLLFSIVGIGPGLLFCLKNNIPVKKRCVIILFLLSCFATLMSYSKQAYITVFIAFIISAFLYSNNIIKTLRNLLIFGVVLLAFFLALSILADKMSIFNAISKVALYNFNILFSEDALLSQESYRITEITQSVAAIKENIIFGIGFGNSYYQSGSNLDNWVHNGWLWLWLDTGIIGVILIMIPLVLGFKKYFRTRKNVNSDQIFLLNIAVIYIVTICVNCLASPIFFRDYPSMLLLGMFTGYLNRKTHGRRKRVE